MSDQSMNLSAVTPDQAAKIFSAVFARKFTPEQILELAEAGELLREDGTFSLIEYTAYLAREFSNG